jgi:hypothetical protein
MSTGVPSCSIKSGEFLDQLSHCILLVIRFGYVSETLVPVYKTTRHHIPEERNIYYYLFPKLISIDTAV